MAAAEETEEAVEILETTTMTKTREIERYRILTLYDVVFFGESIRTIVSFYAKAARNWIASVENIHRRRARRLVVGLDIEWRPSFNRYTNYPAATLQLCVGHRCLVFQLKYCYSIPSELKDFLANPDYTFVGVGIKQDLEKLQEGYQFGGKARAVDLRSLAAEAYGARELKNAGLKSLGKLVIGKEMDKPKKITLSRWDNKRLTIEQVQYACIDAFVAFEIGRVLKASSASPSAVVSGPQVRK